MLIMLASIIFYATAGSHEGSFYTRNILIMLFILFTNPVGAHMLSKNAYKSGVPHVGKIGSGRLGRPLLAGKAFFPQKDNEGLAAAVLWLLTKVFAVLHDYS